MYPPDRNGNPVYKGYWEVYLEAKKRTGKSGHEGLLIKDASMVAHIAHIEGIMYLARKYHSWTLIDFYAKQIQDIITAAGIDHVVKEVNNPEGLDIPRWKQAENERLERRASIPLPGTIPGNAPIEIPEVPKPIDLLPVAKEIKLPEKRQLPTRAERLEKTMRMGGPVRNKKELQRMVIYLKDQGKTEDEIDYLLPGWRNHVRG
jgi:hypothetical protein